MKFVSLLPIQPRMKETIISLEPDVVVNERQAQNSEPSLHDGDNSAALKISFSLLREASRAPQTDLHSVRTELRINILRIEI